jgi:membrane-associated protein
MLDWLKAALHYLSDVEGIIRAGGLAGICMIIFAETGLFFGFFLPGDSLLVTAGILSAAGYLSLPLLVVLVSLCAVAGDQVGYGIGRQAGQALYRREDSFFFRKEHLKKAHKFYEKYGAKTIVIARFVPIVRTFAPAVAGAAQMTYRTFVTYNIAGGLLWVFSMVLGGYFLGRSVPNINRHLHVVIAVVVFLSLLPAIIEFLRARRSQTAPVPGAMPEQD